MARLVYSVRKRPYHNGSECGDICVAREFKNHIFIGVVDVLGHGPSAAVLATAIEEFLYKNYQMDPEDMMISLHKHLQGSRGAVAGLCNLDLDSGEIRYVGIGNITARTFVSTNTRIISRSGVIGYNMPTPREEIARIRPSDVFIMYSDGVEEHFELGEYSELLTDDVETIASHIVSRFGKEEDDAICFASRYLE